MTLVPILDSTRAALRKLEREMYRALHQRSPIHKADHFYNFCVTAHSLRDYFFHEKGIKQRQQQRYHDHWNQRTFLVAVREVANSSKHFVLNKASRTRNVRLGRGSFIDILQSEDGDLQIIEVAAPDYYVTFSDGSRADLWLFMNLTIEFWRRFLKVHGIKTRRQSFEQLNGGITYP